MLKTYLFKTNSNDDPSVDLSTKQIKVYDGYLTDFTRKNNCIIEINIHRQKKAINIFIYPSIIERPRSAKKVKDFIELETDSVIIPPYADLGFTIGDIENIFNSYKKEDTILMV